MKNGLSTISRAQTDLSLFARPHPRSIIFISYSHADRWWLGRVLVHLKPLQRTTNVDLWSDLDIKPGTIWLQELEAAIQRARIAVLLISADFFASDFITEYELPSLLEKARNYDLAVLTLIVKPSRFLREPTLAKYQTVNDPNQPLIDLSEGAYEAILDKLAQEIETILGPRVK